MSQALTTTQAAPFASSGALVPHNMDEAIRLAQFMAGARTVPKHLWDSPGDCLMVIELAMRWGMSPFAVAQATSIIQGKQMIEGKLVAAAVENSGAIVGHIDYDFAGIGDARSITVTATRRGETNPRTVEVKLADAKTSNPLWVKQPDQQLVYHGARVWARRWTPAVILGVYSREEMGPIIDGTAEEQPPPDRRLSQMTLAEVDAGRQALNAQIPLRSAAAATPRAPRKADPEVYEADPAQNRFYRQKPADESTAQPQRTDEQWRIFLDKLRAAVAVLHHRSEVVEIGGRATVGDALAAGPEWVQREISSILAEAYARFPAEPGDDLDEVVIAGEEKLASG